MSTMECLKCGERPDPLTTQLVTGRCAFCGSYDWVDIDDEPPENDGEPDESGDERAERLGVQPR